MVIKTTLTAKNYNATLKPALKLFKGAVVYVEFTLVHSIISSINGKDVEDSISLNALQDVKLKLKTPTGTETLESLEVIDNRARFKIQVSEEIGEYPFMIMCYDNDGCVFHLPASKYTIVDTI